MPRPHRLRPGRLLLPGARPLQSPQSIPKSNFSFKISRLLKMQRDIFRFAAAAALPAPGRTVIL